MRPLIARLIFLLLPFSLSAQSYFPPTSGNQWDTIAPQSLGWCEDRIDSLYAFLEGKNTKSFLVLKGGKIVLERYFGTYTQDSLWYWASAGKSLTAMLVGIAQSEGLLNIQDTTSDYLGAGWTSASPAQEQAITLRHQLTMTTGLDDNVADLDCLDPACLGYLTDPGARWAYYNAPYRLLLDVLAQASGQAINPFTLDRIGSKIGMGGLWLNYIRYGKARDMARFGLLALHRGVWSGDTLLSDTSYFHAMTHPSQTFNPAYGYLWWLNGTGSYMLPRLQFLFNTDLMPNAPSDMYAALGKNDQKIYVIPSMDMVVVRQGNAAGNSLFALSSFDNELWGKMNDLACATTGLEAAPATGIRLSPNPARETLRIESAQPVDRLEILDLAGRRLFYENPAPCTDCTFSLAHLTPGTYLLVIQANGRRVVEKFVREP